MYSPNSVGPRRLKIDMALFMDSAYTTTRFAFGAWAV